MPFRRKISGLHALLSMGPLQAGGFFRNVLALATGTALSQAIMLAALPLLTRLFTPGEFGILAQFTVLSTILSTIACLGYEPAIVLPKRRGTALALWILCLLIGFVVSGLSWLIFATWSTEIAALMGEPELANWLNLIPITLFVWAMTVATTQWCTRIRQFGTVSAGMVVNRLATVSTQALLGLTPFLTGTAGLLTGFIVGSVAGMGVLMQQSRKNLVSSDWQRLRLKRLLFLASYYRDFPGFGLLSNLLGAIVRALPVFALGVFFEPAIVGYFALANQLVAGPVQLVTNAIVDVFYERAKRASDEGNLKELTASVYGNLVSVLMTPLALLCIAAPELISLALGPDWLNTGIFLRWMAIWFYFLSIITPLFRIFLVLDRQNELAIINVASLLVSVVTLAAGGIYGDALFTVILFCTGTALVRTGEALRVMYISGNRMRLVVELPTKEFLKSAPLILPMVFGQFVSNNEFIISGMFVLLLAIYGATRLKGLMKPSA